jgi:lysophospholipase L1-like esterase
VSSYPDGVYAYPSSIAGRLKAYLEQHKPGARYEVINASGFERRIHQSFIQYVQSLAKFHPDVIVNLEGMNDVYSIASGTPFEDVEQQLPFYVDLYRRPHSPLNYSATYYVLSTAYEKWINRRGGAAATDTAETTPRPAESQTRMSGPSGKEEKAAPPPEYEKKLADYRRHCEPLLRVLREYFAVLKADQTRCIFALQPLLHRRKVNKQLSPTEQRLFAVMAPQAATSAAPPDEHTLLLMYFYDDFLSGAIKKIAGEYGVSYVDVNAEITGLGPDAELYTDYCHLTPEGNRRVAEILGRVVLGGR